MIVSMVFYGLSLNTGNLYGNFYITFLVMVLVEFPGHILPLVTIDKFGRRKSHFVFMLIGGLGCLSTIFTVSYGGKGIWKDNFFLKFRLQWLLVLKNTRWKAIYFACGHTPIPSTCTCTINYSLARVFSMPKTVVPLHSFVCVMGGLFL